MYAGCIYYKPPIRTSDRHQLTRKELANKIEAKEFENLGLHLNHNEYCRIGKIVEAYQDESDGSVYVYFTIDESNPLGRHAAENVGKLYPGLSLSHHSRTRDLIEVSLCGKGYRENTVILPNGQKYLSARDLDSISSSPQYQVPLGRDITVECSLFAKNRYVIANAPSTFDQLLEMEEVKIEEKEKEKVPESDETKLREQAINQLATSDDPANKALLALVNKLVDDNTKFKKYDQKVREEAEKRLDKAVMANIDPKTRELILKNLLADQAVIDAILNETESSPPPPQAPQAPVVEKKTAKVVNKSYTDNLLSRINNLERANMMKRKADPEDRLVQASDELFPKSTRQDFVRSYFGDKVADSPYMDVARERFDELFQKLDQVNCSQSTQPNSSFEDVERNILAAANRKYTIILNSEGKRSFD